MQTSVLNGGCVIFFLAEFSDFVALILHELITCLSIIHRKASLLIFILLFLAGNLTARLPSVFSFAGFF